MTEEQILQLAEQFFCCNISVMEYSARREDIIKFAWEIYGIASDETLQDYESKF